VYCTKCGTERGNATVCPNCGHAAVAAQAYAPAAPIPNYLVQSLLVTFCCCMPFGIVALIFAAQVNSKLAAGDVAGAQSASKNARMFCWIGFGLTLILLILSLAFNGAGIYQAIQEGAANR
jgi:hypothetical protein